MVTKKNTGMAAYYAKVKSEGGNGFSFGTMSGLQKSVGKPKSKLWDTLR